MEAMGDGGVENPPMKAKKAKAKRLPPENLQEIQAEVAYFAASLGLASPAGNSSGFDDSDFRKKGSIRKTAESGEAGKEKSKSNIEAEEVSGKKRGIKQEIAGKGEGASGKWKKDRGDGIKASVLGKDAKKGSRSEPGKSKIHEVLDGGILTTPTNTKKRKGSWHDRGSEANGAGAQHPKRSFLESVRPDEANSVQKLREEAQQLMDKAAQAYERSKQKDSDAHFLMTARRSGTSADKVAAMTVMLQDNPQANVRTLDALIGMLTSMAGKRHAATGIDALKELFIYSLLPDRKLKYFSQQPVETLSETKDRASELMKWYWEDCLKHRYERFVIALEEATKDKLLFLKEKALKTVFELLKSKPEQERRLLAALVNKLGDPDRKMASNASYLLSCLLTTHPNMKKVVVDEVDAFVFRPHVGLRARYYAAIFLNQIVLSNRGDGPKLAKQLIDLYFSLFKAVTSVVGEEDLVKRKKEVFGKKKGLGKVKTKEHSADFTMEIDSRLLSALLTGVNRAFPYITAEDLDTVTQENSVLFRLAHSTNLNVAVQALTLLHQLLAKNHAVSDRFYRALYSVLLSEGLFKSSKAEMFLGLVFKALKSDVDSRRVFAFAKRLTQVAMEQPPQFACGSLLLLSEILKARPTLWNSILQPEDRDDDVEHFEDVKDETDDMVVETNGLSKELSGTGVVLPKNSSYDPKHRDPLYCNAHKACWWELVLLAHHVHPSVAAMARTLLSGTSILYSGDPIKDLAFGAFLDRFAEKKPKANKSKVVGQWHGSALQMPSKMVGALSTRPVGEQFSLLAEGEVAPEDMMFHKFYVMKSTKKKSKTKKKKSKEDDEDDITSLDGVGGDDSEDEEVDALLEEEADAAMDGADDSEGEVDSDDEDERLSLDGGGEDGSLEEGFDDSEDEEADALLEAGLAMSSDEDEDEDEEDDNNEWNSEDSRLVSLSKKERNKPGALSKISKNPSIFQEVEPTSKKGKAKTKPDRKSSKKPSMVQDGEGGAVNLISKKGKTPPKKKDSVFLEVESDHEDGLMVAVSKKGKPPPRRKRSVFQEADSDGEDGLVEPMTKKGKTTPRGKRSVFQDVGSDDEDGLMEPISKKKGKTTPRGKKSVFQEDDGKDGLLESISKKKKTPPGGKHSVFQEVGSDSEDELSEPISKKRKFPCKRKQSAFQEAEFVSSTGKRKVGRKFKRMT